MTDPDDTTTTHLRLTRAEALVLFEWLARAGTARSVSVEDPAEAQVLWRLEGQLEAQLTEPLAATYKELVEAARQEVRGQRP